MTTVLSEELAEKSPPEVVSLVMRQGQEIKRLNMKIDMLNRRLWGAKSERSEEAANNEVLNLFSADLVAELEAYEGAESAAVRQVSLDSSEPGSKKSKQSKGPRPIDPNLPREVIVLPDPEGAESLKVAFKERLEVLSRRKPEYYVKAYVRSVFVCPDKSAPVATPWPETAWARAHVDASVVAHIATAHYTDHTPFYRIEKQLKRMGVSMARSTQVSLMKQLDTFLTPLVSKIKTDVLTSGYVHLDATPVKVMDPNRPRQAREATVWAYRSGKDSSVFFDFQMSKSLENPHNVLTQANYSGILQTDGAQGMGKIGPPNNGNIHVGCWAHARRYFYEAVQLKDSQAIPYLLLINRLFMIERRAKVYALNPERYQLWRTRFSLVLLDQLFSMANLQSASVLPKSPLGKALSYIIKQREPLSRCITTPGVRIDNNPVENTIRPIKLGLKNWLFIGHPDAGERMANLYTVLENCRQAEIDPEDYLVDIIASLQNHKSSQLHQLMPKNWKATRKTAA